MRAFSLHPGRILDSSLARHMSEEELAPFRPRDDEQRRAVTSPEDYIKNVQEGAATSVWCATSRLFDGMAGVYCEDCDVAPLAPTDSQGLGVRPYAIDPELAERLWSLSITLTATQIAR